MPFLILFLIAALTAVDQFIKMQVIMNLKPVGTIGLIPKLLELTYVENFGVAFGFLSGLSWLIIALTVVVLIGMLFFVLRYKHHTFLSYASCILIIAGGIGNVIDRIAFGYVVDYIHVMFFPYVFNFADCCVVVGAVLFAVWYLFIKDKKEKGISPEESDDGSVDS
ncbi:MAG: signal peptidase II [Lachnospiraceae bacterium]|nr:signal peptidase II [Lachnospiraceae bacterium]